jgi:hypothetical protein
MDFYLQLDKSKISDEKSYSNFIGLSGGTFRKILLNKLNYEKCLVYDELLKSNAKLIGIKPENIFKGFTYNILEMAIDSIRHVKTSLGEHYYTIDIPIKNPFGKKVLVDKIIRILEYGQGKIRPYMIFNEGFTEYKLLIIKRFNKLF